jgi:ribosomal protein S4
MSISSRNIFNLSRLRQLDFKGLTITEAEWKSKTMVKLYILGDVKTSQLVDTIRACHGNMFRAIETIETRLDNLLFRCHFADSVYQARMFIGSRNVEVNGTVASRPSQLLKVNDMITLRRALWERIVAQSSNPLRKFFGFVPNYIDVNYASFSAILQRHPAYQDVPMPFGITTVRATGAFYSRRI